MKVEDIYSDKVFRITPQQTLKDAVAEMVKNKTNTLVVVDDQDHYLGLLTSKCLIMAILPDFLEDPTIAALAQEELFEKLVLDSANMPVQSMMNTTVKSVRLDVPLIRVAANVLYQNESRLPVVNDNNKVLGIVTRTQIKNAMAAVLGVGEIE